MAKWIQPTRQRGRILPVDRGELAAIIARRCQTRRLDCPYIFHRQGRRIGEISASSRLLSVAFR